MGSGGSSGYGNGGKGGSQPYAPTYHVTGDMLSKDKSDSDIYSPTKGYFKNPTATNLESAIDGNRIVFEGRSASNELTYVMNQNGDIIFGKRCNPNDARKRSPHPTLIGGKDPQVQCAGIIKFHKGRILSIDNNSGHYKPNVKSLDKVNAKLQALCDKNPDIFDKNSTWRKKR